MLDFVFDNKIDIIASCIGLLYLYLEYKANIFMWFASIIMALLFIYTFWDLSYYGSFTIYVYFFCASIYGWIVWIKSKKIKPKKYAKEGVEVNNSVQILRLPYKWRLIIIAIILIITTIIYFLLQFTNEDSSFIIFDALVSSLNIVALWMASRRWAEQWFLLIPANLISSVMLYSQGNYATAVMFFVYFFGSIAGYINWRNLATKQIS